jgi:hypothetical protein
LKKRSKKLLPVSDSAFPDRLSPNEQKFFGSFFQKRTAEGGMMARTIEVIYQ